MPLREVDLLFSAKAALSFIEVRASLEEAMTFLCPYEVVDRQ